MIFRLRPLASTLFILLIAGSLSPVLPDSLYGQSETRRNVTTSGSGTTRTATHIVRGSLSQTAVGRLQRGRPLPDSTTPLHLVGFWHTALRPEIITTVSLPLIETNVETRITIPLTLESQSVETPFIPRPFTARIRFNATILHPIDGMPDCSYSDGTCTIEISDIATVENGTIAELRFLTALGNAERTELEIVDFNWERRAEERFAVRKVPGEVLLLDVCREGDEHRVIRSGSAARLSLSPNPARNRVTIEYTSNEAGRAEVTLVDLLGNRVVTVAEGSILPDRLYRDELDLHGIPAGSYLILYRTPQSIMSRRLIVGE